MTPDTERRKQKGEIPERPPRRGDVSSGANQLLMLACTDHLHNDFYHVKLRKGES